MSKTTPTQRSLALLRAEGAHAEVVERWNAHARIRQDLLGLGDLLALQPATVGPLLIQVTSGSNLAARRTKALAEPRLRLWLASGGRFELHGWALRGARGEPKTWTCKREALTLADLAGAPS